MTRHVLCPAACLFTAVVAAACVEPPAHVGTIAVALTAPGPNGSIYRLPSAVLQLDNAGFHGAFLLDGDGRSTTVDVPAGDYTVSAFQFAGGDEWPLTREHANGTSETILATLDPPPAINVTQDHTTPLVLRFHIPSLEPITFSLGSVEVSVDVEGDHASSVDFAMSASSMLVSSFGVMNAPAGFASRLPVMGSIGDSVSVTAHITGSWSLTSPSEVCAPAFAFASAMGHPGFVNLVAEVSTTDKVCIIKGDHVTLVWLTFHREGPAQTPLLSDFGALPFVITELAVAIINDPDVFDGRVLRLDRLIGSRPASVGMNGEVGVAVGTLPDGTTLRNPWFSFTESATGTLALIAQ